MRNRSGILILFLLLLGDGISARQSLRDSLFAVLKTAKHDTTRFSSYMELASLYNDIDRDSALYFRKSAISVAEKIKDPLRLGDALRQMGIDFYNSGDYDQAFVFENKAKVVAESCIKNSTSKKELGKARKLYATVLSSFGIIYRNKGDNMTALDYYDRALRINQEINNKKGQSTNLTNIGIVYTQLGDYPNALRYYFRALKLTEETGNILSQAATLGNIGVVFRNQNDLENALRYFTQAFKLNEQIGRKSAAAVNLGNIGSVYTARANYDEALRYFNQALNFNILTGSKEGQAMNTVNMGVVYMALGDSAVVRGKKKEALDEFYPLAADYYLKSLRIFEQMGNNNGVAAVSGNLGALFTKRKQYAVAERYLKKSLDMAIKVKALKEIVYAHNFFFLLHEANNKPTLALKHYRLYIQFKDSMQNEENARKLIQQEFKFNYEKKHAADSVSFAKHNAIREAEIARQSAELKSTRNRQYALVSGLLLVIGFSVVMYNRFTLTRKQKQIIETQKRVVEMKQKEILDSIHYAKRIQTALMPGEYYIRKQLERLKS